MTPELSEEEFTRRLEVQTVISQEYLEAAFGQWLDDREDARSPFPEYMHDELYTLTFRQFMEWAFQQEVGADEDQLGHAFAEIIREIGLSLAQSEDDRITIRYPHLPRLGDTVNLDGDEVMKGEVSRRWISTTGDKLDVVIRFEDGNERETGFKLT